MALMEIDLVTELVNIPIDRVVPMPHLPPAVMGVYNWRGEILWIVDLARLLGVKAALQQMRSLQPTIMLTNGMKNGDRDQKIIGLVVDEIAEIEWFDLDLIQSPVPTNIYPEVSSCVSGLLVSATGENFLVLDGKSIFRQSDVHATL